MKKAPHLLVSQQGLCYSIWLSPFQGNQTPPRIPAHPTLGVDWCAPHEASSNPQCLQFLLPPSHCLLSEQAIQGGGKKKETWISGCLGNQNQKPPNFLWGQSISLQGQGNSGCCIATSSSITWSTEIYRDIKLLNIQTSLYFFFLNRDGGKEELFLKRAANEQCFYAGPSDSKSWSLNFA